MKTLGSNTNSFMTASTVGDAIVYSPAALPASVEAELFVPGHTSSTAASRARRLGSRRCSRFAKTSRLLDQAGYRPVEIASADVLSDSRWRRR
jgi:hypothetical protein